MPENNGRKFERLVEHFERTLSPKGFRVETRKPIYDESGTQIAELDILISGKVGSGTFRCLIECRDRPSEGTAPVSWIEQLIGRRNRLQLDKVMAVSSTGFGKPAIDAAIAAGIELRELHSLNSDTFVASMPQVAPLIIRNGNPTRVLVYLLPSDDEDDRQIPLPVDKPVLAIDDTDERLSLLEVWYRTRQCDSVWKNVAFDEPPCEVQVVVSEHLSHSFKISVEGQHRLVQRIEFTALLQITRPQMLMASSVQYTSPETVSCQNHPLAVGGQWIGPDDALVKELVVIAVPKPEERSNDVSSDT